jgi:hypothetical protein
VEPEDMLYVWIKIQISNHPDQAQDPNPAKKGIKNKIVVNIAIML